LIPSPTAPRPRPCAPISCGCGSPTFSSGPAPHRHQAHAVRQTELHDHPAFGRSFVLLGHQRGDERDAMPSQGGDNTKQNNQQSVSSEHVEDVDGFHSPEYPHPRFCNLAQTQGRREMKPPEAEPAGFIAVFHRKGVSGHSPSVRVQDVAIVELQRRILSLLPEQTVRRPAPRFRCHENGGGGRQFVPVSARAIVSSWKSLRWFDPVSSPIRAA
jgi:hypothetical protein